MYESGWRIDDAGQLTIEIAIPFNAPATVELPGAQLDDVSINGHSLQAASRLANRPAIACN